MNSKERLTMIHPGIPTCYGNRVKDFGVPGI